MNTSSGMSWSSTALAFGFDVAVKATAIMVITLLIQRVVGRRRVLIASAIGNAGLIGLWLLPFSAVLVPSVSIACLPGEVVPHAVVAPPRALADQMLPIGPALNPTSSESRSDIPRVARSVAITSVPAAPAAYTTAAPGGSPRIRHTDWAAIAIIGYLIVVLVLLARMGLSLWDVAGLKRSRVAVDDRAWTEALEHWRRRLAIDRAVALAWSPRVGVPVVLGWLRPTILLPPSLVGPNSRTHADAVLLHELAHVRRADYFWNLVLRFAQALYWPHVLVWLLGRNLAELRERACDDLCVHEMGGPSAYRETLLVVASGMLRRPGPALGLAMAEPSKLGRRLARIEQSVGAARCLPRWPVRLAIASMAITAAGVIGAIQLVQTNARATLLDESPQAANPMPPTAKGERVLQLQVVAAETGNPVPHADVRVSILFEESWRKTDAKGRLDIKHSNGLFYGNLGVDVWGKGRAMQRHDWGNDPNKAIPDEATIKLQPGESLGGLVQDEEGRPIAGATIDLWSHNYRKKDPHELLYDLRAVSGADGKWQTSGAPETTGELLGFKIIHPEFLSSRDYDQKEIIPKIADLRAGAAVTVMKKGVPIEGRVVDADGKPVAGARVLSTAHPHDDMFDGLADFAVFTDAKGRFRTGQVKPGEWFLVASAKGHAPGDQRVRIGTAVPQVEIALSRPRPLKGRVVDPDGKPIAGAFINPDGWRGYRCLGTNLWTDADGRFRWDDAPDQELIINVSQQGFQSTFQQKVSPSIADAVFTLKPSLTIKGSVRDAETKKRVDNATVEYSAVDPTTGEASKWTPMPQFGFSIGVYQGQLSVTFPITADAYRLRVQSPGFQTFFSRTFRREEKVVHDYDITLIPGQPLGAVATVLRSDGKPLAGARVYRTPVNEGFNVEDGRVKGRGANGREDRTGPDGTFPMPQSDQPWFFLILGDDQCAYANNEELAKSPRIVAKPYAQIEGRCLIGTRVMIDQPIELQGTLAHRSARNCNVFLSQKTMTDRQGRFTFKYVIPDGGFRVKRIDPKAMAQGIWWIGDPVRVEPGATTRMTLGGKGRPVIGRVEPPDGWSQPIDFTVLSEARIETDQPLNPYPLSLFRGKNSRDGFGILEWLERNRDSAEVREHHDRRVSIGTAIASDGSFRIDDVPPGQYRLSIRVNGAAIHHVSVQFRREPGPFSHILRTFGVPPVPGGRSDEPLDLGVMRLEPRAALKIGDPAPPFEVRTIAGKKLAVPRDFQGKFALIDFGTMWDIQAPHQIPQLNELNQKLGKDPRFAILSLIFAADGAATKTFIEEKGEPWDQAIVGPFANAISSAYGIDDENASTSMLIGPDGKIVATEFWRTNLSEAVGKAMGGSAQPARQTEK